MTCSGRAGTPGRFARRQVYCLHLRAASVTTADRRSSAGHVPQWLRSNIRLLAAGLALPVLMTGCDLFHAHFDIAVGNRTASTVSIFSNGGKIGEVGSNQTATFSVEESPTGRTTVD